MRCSRFFGFIGLQARICNPETDKFGTLPLVQSKAQTGTVWTEMKDITAALEGQTVRVRARVHNVRAKGLSRLTRPGFGVAVSLTRDPQARAHSSCCGRASTPARWPRS
jgi:hypothetical protein